MQSMRHCADTVSLRRHQQANLLENLDSKKAELACLLASLWSFALEDIPGLLLSVFKMKASDASLFSLTGLQYSFSVLMCGYALCNSKSFIQTSKKVAKKQKELGDILESASTSLDAFKGVHPRELLRVVELRHMLPSSLNVDESPRDVLGDLMLLRRVRARFPPKEEEQTGVDDSGAAAAEALVAVAAAVTAASAKRTETGVDAIREQILRKDLASVVIF